jgi:HEAT repeat protein
MEQILIVTIGTITIVFVGLTLGVVLNKALREARDRYSRHRRRVIEPRVLAYAHGDDDFGKRVARRDRRIVQIILLDHLQRVRGVEHQRLGNAFSQMGFTDELLKRLESSRWWQRAAAAEKLGLAGAERAIEPLITLLQDDAPEVRIRAAKALGELGGPLASFELVAALNSPDRWSTIRIADILTGMGREVVSDLLDAFPQLAMRGRLAALDVLGRIRPLQASEWLVERLADEEADVRARACHALGCIGDPDSITPLTSALDDTDWPVRAMAAKALGRIRQVDSIRALCKKLRDEEWWVRSNAAHALVAIGKQGLQALEDMLTDSDTFARHQVILILEQAGVLDQRVLELASDNPIWRDRAEVFVRRFLAAGEVQRLRELEDVHPDSRARLALSVLLTGFVAKVEQG